MKIRNVVKGSAQQMKLIAQDAISLIQVDAMRNGMFQNNRSGFGYSDQYKKYKSNSMRGIKTGQKLKSYKSNKAPDTTTTFVNMRLSGTTFDGMLAKGKTNVGIITYTKNGNVVLWNKDRGYDIFDLRDKNRELVAEEYAKRILDRNIKKYVSKTITIK
jgi:hypothetical protein